MSRKGDGWDNACAESCLGTLEQELRAEANWDHEENTHAAVGACIHTFYNPVRRHSTLGRVSPIARDGQFWVKQSAAAW